MLLLVVLMGMMVSLTMMVPVTVTVAVARMTRKRGNSLVLGPGLTSTVRHE